MQRSMAHIRMWVVRSMFDDLLELHGGDENRFGRMVGAGGASTPGCTAGAFAGSILASSDALSAWFPDEVAQMVDQLMEWGYVPREDD